MCIGRPVWLSNDEFNVFEETTPLVADLAVDVEGQGFYEIVGGPDAEEFEIDPNTGLLQFSNGAPDFENPTDAGQNNTYNLTVQFMDFSEATVTREISVNVEDDPDDKGGPIDPATAQIGNQVWLDANGDGIRQNSEANVGGIKVSLNGAGDDGVFGTNDDIHQMMRTTSAGWYDFKNLKAGDYKVTFSDLPDGFEFTQANVGANEGRDSDADEATGMTEVITLIAGEKNGKVDAGLVQEDEAGKPDPGTAQIGNQVWVDANGDGIRQNSEANIGGIKVSLTGAGDDGVFGTNDDISQMMRTTSAGWYDFKNLKAGDYKVTFSDLPEGFEFTQANVGANEGRDSDADEATGMTEVITLTAGERNSKVDAGLVEKGGGNVGPDAVNDTATTPLNTPITLDVLANDSDPDGDRLSISSVETPGNGAAQIVDGEIVYTPAAGFSGTDTFTYHISDGNGGTDTATVNVDVEKPKVDLSVTKTAFNIGRGGSIAYRSAIMQYSVTVTNNSTSEVPATGVVVKDIVPENIDIGEFPNDIDIRGEFLSRTPSGAVASNGGAPIDPSNGTVTIVDPGIATRRSTLGIRPGFTYGLPEGSVTWEVGESIAPGESVTLTYFGRRAGQGSDFYEPREGTQFFTDASIVAVDQHDTNPKNDHDSALSHWASPISLDLNGDGIQTRSIDQGVKFDLLNTGEAINTGWLSGDDGFLAIDNDGDGLISSRAELFGGGVGDGFAKLSTFDSNGDGLVNPSDAQFRELKLWQDANENGITDPGELMSLEAAGITDLNTVYTNVFASDVQGNIHGEVSSALKNGSTIEMTDVYFQVQG